MEASRAPLRIRRDPGRRLNLSAELTHAQEPLPVFSSRILSTIRLCCDDERAAILAIINAAAEAYRDVIPADRWHEPYMPQGELDREIAAGVVFWGYEADDDLLGVMGIQRVRNVDLIRHAYVKPDSQRLGVGGALLEHLRSLSPRRMLVGTWAAAEWAIAFYQRHSFELVSPERKVALLKTYWTVPDRQIQTSVVLEAAQRREVQRRRVTEFTGDL
jgi:GNAT superfamily N-acetyltransferase